MVSVIDLDAWDWSEPLDFYSALYAELGVPSWQGYGIAATIDSIIWRSVNRVQPPFIVKVRNLDRAPETVVKEIGLLKQCLRNARAEHIARKGSDVDVEIVINSGH